MIEYELNRAWITNEDGEEIGETNFVVPGPWLFQVFKKYFAHHNYTFEEFLQVYEPETDGEFIYQQAKKDGTLIVDLGRCMYSEFLTE